MPSARPASARAIRFGGAVVALLLGAGLAAGGQAGSPSAAAVPAEGDDRGVVHPSVDRTLQGKGADPSVRVIVSLDPGTNLKPTRPTAIRSARAAVLDRLPQASYDVVARYIRIPAVSLEINGAALEKLAQDPLVKAVSEDHVIEPQMLQANAITGADDVHASGITGDGSRVAIIDSGVDANAGVVHPALADDLLGQACFRTEGDCLGGPSSAEDEHGHGTHVAGIVTGPQGVAPDAGFYALKVFTTGDTSDTNILNALDHVIALNAATPGTVDLVNMSLGGDTFTNQGSCNAANAAYVDAFASLNSQGATVFVATGNDASTTSVAMPACVTGAVGVGSTGDATRNLGFSSCFDEGQADKVSCFSNATPLQGAGELVDVLAPGCLITSLGLNGGTNSGSCGTSMAAPYAAGVAALVLELAAGAGETLTPAGLESLLEETGVPIADYRLGGSLTFPRVSAAAAIAAAVAPGVIVAPTEVDLDEGGGADSYAVRLRTPPAADVTVAITGDEDCVTDPSSLTFSGSDWADPQPVIVSAPDDGVDEAQHTCAISHAVTSDDPGYDGIAVAGVTGTIAETVTDPPVRGRPDARIRKGARGTLLGDDVYGTRDGQTSTATARRGRSVTFFVPAQNDADVADRLRLRGGRSSRHFAVSYFAPNGSKVTRKVINGTLRTPILAPGAAYQLKVVVTVGPRARRGAALRRAVTAASVAEPEVADAVRYVVTRR